MDDTEMLPRFFEFDRWANEEALRSLETMKDPPDRAVALIAHIAATQRVWIERALSLPQSVAVWPRWSLPETAKELLAAHREWTRLIATDDLSRAVAYTNTKGQPFGNKLRDVALHVAFHGVYHRGQISALVRQHGGEPAYTDFIHAVRTGAVRDRITPLRISRDEQQISLHSTCGLRRPRPSDVDAMAELAVQLGYQCSGEEIRKRLSAMENRDDYNTFVVELPSGRLAGWIGVSVSRCVEMDDCAQISGLIVDERSRSHGFGKILLGAAEVWARSVGCDSILVPSNVIRDRAHRFYVGNGYEHIKSQKIFRKSLR